MYFIASERPSTTPERLHGMVEDKRSRGTLLFPKVVLVFPRKTGGKRMIDKQFCDLERRSQFTDG